MILFKPRHDSWYFVLLLKKQTFFSGLSQWNPMLRVLHVGCFFWGADVSVFIYNLMFLLSNSTGSWITTITTISLLSRSALALAADWASVRVLAWVQAVRGATEAVGMLVHIWGGGWKVCGVVAGMEEERTNSTVTWSTDCRAGQGGKRAKNSTEPWHTARREYVTPSSSGSRRNITPLQLPESCLLRAHTHTTCGKYMCFSPGLPCGCTYDCTFNESTKKTSSDSIRELRRSSKMCEFTTKNRDNMRQASQ